MPKIHLEKLIRAERQAVFDLVANYENFQNILPQYFPSIRVRSVRDNVAVVEEHIKLGNRELVMTTKHVTKYPELHEIFVLGGDAKGSHIVEKYEKTDQGTMLIVDAHIKLSGAKAIAAIFAKKKISSDFGKIIDEFAKIAEKS
ncbi:MAG TPA: polyketide cyclase [Candidatus Nitrosotenuis sp.]|nr:polyketide cyclase [Candidatus Nitrosotenuis sp.]